MDNRLIKKRKFFLPFTAIEKQEKWLNSMNKQGYELVGTDYWSYSFIHSNRNHTYKVEYVEPMSIQEYNDYISFLEESNISFFTKNLRHKYSFPSTIRITPFGWKKWRMSTKKES